MDNPVEEIKRRIDIVDFIGSFLTLKKSGRNFKALCPFHQEKTPSFVISPERQIWHCFGACGEGGDIIKFLMKWENITFFEALKELAEKTGVALKKVSFEDRVWKKKERLLKMNGLATEFFEYVLNKTSFGKKGREYIVSRGIKPPIVKKFQLGYAPASWNSLLKFLKKKKFEEEEMFDAGLLVKGEKGGFYDRFRGRLIFPIKDTRDQVIAFSGRNLDEDDKSAKYINTPETLIYHKRETLFGIHLAREAIKQEKNVFIVEGEFDVILPYQHGFTNFVAIKGSALTREQLMLLKRYTNKITLGLDTDEAGVEAIKKGIEEAEKLDFEIGIISFDFAKDPDEAVRNHEDKFKKILKKPIPIYDYLMTTAQKKFPEDNPFSKKKIGEEVIPFIERINNPIVQSYYIKKLAGLLNVSESSIETLIRKIRQKKKQPYSFSPIKKKTTDVVREFLIQRYVLSLIFQNDSPYRLAEKVFSILLPADFSIVSYQKLCKLFLELKKMMPKKFDLTRFTSLLSHELQPVFDEIFLFASTELGFENEKMEKLAYEIKRFSLKRKISEALSQDDSLDLSLLSRQLKEVEKKLVAL